MSQQAITPTLVSTVLDACRIIRDGRSFEDIYMHALSELGELAIEVSIAEGRAAGRLAGIDGVTGEALDLVLCAVDLIHTRDEAITDRDLVSALNSRVRDRSIATLALGSPPFKQKASLQVVSIADDLADLAREPDEDVADVTAHKRILGAHLIMSCLCLIRSELPGITEDDLIRMAKPKLAKWMASAVPGETLLMEGEA